MNQAFFDWQLLWVTLIKIGAAFALALPTGYITEREGHSAGIRTLPIVAIASCGYLLAMGAVASPDASGNSSRVLQGLIAGIGFVGGGAILKEGVNVHGTAIAASIWNTGAIGAAVAFGRYEIAVALALLNVITMKALAPLKQKMDGDRR